MEDPREECHNSVNSVTKAAVSLSGQRGTPATLLPQQSKDPSLLHAASQPLKGPGALRGSGDRQAQATSAEVQRLWTG